MRGKFSKGFVWHAFHCPSERSLTIFGWLSHRWRDQEVGGRGPGSCGYGGVAVAPSQAVFTLVVWGGREAGGISMAAVPAEQGAPLSGDEGGTVHGSGGICKRCANATAVCVVTVLLWEKEREREEWGSCGCLTGRIVFSFMRLTLKASKLLGIASG